MYTTTGGGGGGGAHKLNRSLQRLLARYSLSFLVHPHLLSTAATATVAFSSACMHFILWLDESEQLIRAIWRHVRDPELLGNINLDGRAFLLRRNIGAWSVVFALTRTKYSGTNFNYSKSHSTRYNLFRNSHSCLILGFIKNRWTLFVNGLGIGMS